MMTQADFDEIENEADTIFAEWLREFEEEFSTRPATTPSYVPDETILQLLMEPADDESTNFDLDE